MPWKPACHADARRETPWQAGQIDVAERIGPIEVMPVDRDAIEVAAELNPRAEQALVHMQARRRGMREMNATRLPVTTEHRLHQALQRADRQFHRLTARIRPLGNDLLVDDGDIVEFSTWTATDSLSR
jgi:hypothetical protein